MQAVILAGGFGSRLSEETDFIPKPMVTIGSKPILWHIMKSFEHYGVKDFIICGGYKYNFIVEFFINYRLHNSNISVDIGADQITYLNKSLEDWRVTIINTGEKTMTGGRLKRIREYLNDDKPFFMTYGDGLSNVRLDKVLETHLDGNYDVTLTAAKPPARFGSVELQKNIVTSFNEKNTVNEGYVNGGFFVLNPSVLELINNDETSWEYDSLVSISERKKLGAHVHDGFWQPMDTLRDRRYLEDLWSKGEAPWKVW